MLRVLTLATLFPDRSRPGFGRFVELQTRALAARDGVEVEVVAPLGLPVWPLVRHPHYAPRAALPAEEVRGGLRIHRPRFRVWPRVGTAAAADAMADALLPFLRRMRARFPFHVIDAQFFWPDGPAAMRLAAALGVPFSVKARGSDIALWLGRPGIGARIRQAAAAADGLLAVGEAMKTAMAEAGLPAEKIRVHRTGVDLDCFRPVDRAAAKAALGVQGPLLIAAGALIPLKGQDLALRTLALLPGATLLLAGDGPARPRLVRLARALGLSDRVRFLGAVPHAELPALFAAADILLHASRAEGLANVWVEALACGTPVVAADLPAAREAIDRPAAGRVAARDPEALAAAVREVLAAPPPPEAVRAAAAERFGWDRNAAELHAFLSELVERRRGAIRAA